MKWLVDEAYPDATVIRLVHNLNTHKLGSLYEAFAPSEARRIAKRLEFHHTPNHGSWLNMAEIELSVFSRQCLNRRIGDEALLRREVAALERERNDAGAIIDWRFSTRDARSKLKHVYPIGTKPIPRWDVHFGEIDDDRKGSTAPHITFRPQLGGRRRSSDMYIPPWL